jgi:hypothetical protein
MRFQEILLKLEGHLDTFSFKKGYLKLNYRGRPENMC